MRRTDVIRAEERNTDMYSRSVIYSGTVLIMFVISYGDIFGDQHREIVHDQTCKDLLYHAVLLFRACSHKTLTTAEKELKYRYENDEKTVCKNRAIHADSSEETKHIKLSVHVCVAVHHRKWL